MRIRTIGSQSEVARNWAKGVQTGTDVYRDGGSGESRGYYRDSTSPRCRFYYDGAYIYSYGPHYVCGKRIEHNGQVVALLNTRPYETTVADSPTTKRHRDACLNAARFVGLVIVRLPDLSKSDTLDSALAMLRWRIAEVYLRDYRTCKPHFTNRLYNALSELRRLTVDYNALCCVLGYGEPIPVTPQVRIEWEHDTPDALAAAVTARLKGRLRRWYGLRRLVIGGGESDWQEQMERIVG